MDFGELKNDIDFITKTNNLSESIENVKKHIEEALNASSKYESLSTEDKVKYDLFLVYSINSLYWIYCKLQNTDLSEHGIRNEMSRIRAAMCREKELEDRKLRPQLDVPAAGRFIRHGLWDPNDKKKQQKPTKRKFEETE